MSATIFRPAYNITVTEDGTGKPIRAISFSPTSATVQKLANHKLIFRTRDDGFVLYAQYDAQSGGVRKAPVTGPTPLLFAIRSTDAELLKQYHPDLDNTTGPNILLTNRTANTTIKGSGSLAKAATVEAADATRITGRLLKVRADLVITPAANSIAVATYYTPTQNLPDVKITATAGSTAAAVEVDLSASTSNRFTTAPKPPGNPKTSVFVDDELAGHGVFGVLELVLDAFVDPDPAQGRTYFAHFRRRA